MKRITPHKTIAIARLNFRLVKSFIGIIFLFTSAFAHAQQWNQIESFPGTARDDGAAFTIGDKAYFGTGFEVGWMPTRDFYRLQVSLPVWTQVASLPAGKERQYACGCALYEFGYVFGGEGYGNYYNDLWRYDPASDTWTEMSPLPGEGRTGMACFSFTDRLFFIGGRLADNDYTAQTYTYHPATDSWDQIDDYPGGPVYLLKAGVDGVPGNRAAFVGLGIRPNGTFNSSMYAFLEAANGWTSPMAGLPAGGRAYASMGTYQGKAAVFGGQDSEGNIHNDLWTWKWVGLYWEQGNPLPSYGRRGGMMTSLGGHLFYTTGLNPDLLRVQETWTTDQTVGLDNQTSISSLTLYPNPGRDEIRIAGQFNGILSIRFYSLHGKFCHYSEISELGIIQVAHLPKGMYVVEMSDVQGIVHRFKWVKYE